MPSSLSRRKTVDNAQVPAFPGLKVLHGAWVPSVVGPDRGFFLLWAEGTSSSSSSTRSRKKSGSSEAWHPGLAPPPWLDISSPEKETLLALPTREGRPMPGHPILEEATSALDNGDSPLSLMRWRVKGLTVPPGSNPMAWLLNLPGPETLREQGLLASEDLRFWISAARLSWEMAVGEHFLPAITLEEAGSQFLALWKPLWDHPDMAAKLQVLLKSLPPACFAPILNPQKGVSPLSAKELVEGFIAYLLDQQARSAAKEAFSHLRPNTAQEVWLSALASENGLIQAPPEGLPALAESLQGWEERHRAACREGLRAALRLSAPSNSNGKWTLDYLLQPTADLSLLIRANNLWSDPKTRKKLSAFSTVDPEDFLLTALSLAGRLFPPIEQSLKKAKPSQASLDTSQAYFFLKEVAPALGIAGFGLLLPSWWRAKTSPRLGLKVKIRPKDRGAGLADNLSLDWEMALGDKTLSPGELESLAQMKVPLVQIRGQWVEADPTVLKEALDHWKRLKEKPGTLLDIMNSLREAGGGLEISSITGEGWLRDFFEAGDRGFEVLPPPAGLKAELRPYQQRGYSWLSFLARLGLGACLADDMGLGKTLQTLTFLLNEKAAGRLEKPVLLLCPTSVAGNWMKEAAKFTPDLRVTLRHGGARTRSTDGFRKEKSRSDLVVSTYGLARRDETLLAAENWGGVVLDEAQNIKNPEARQARAVRTLKGSFRLALTGTPVENRLSELWSIFEFLNPGFLGSYNDFSRRFAAPVERYQDGQAASLLRRLTGPFLLRRLKTDPKVVPDLPEKLEMKVSCNLTREQATLYQAVVKDMMARIEAAEGIERRGLVLATLTKLKQVLNHPAHFLKDGSPLPNRSGKLKRLTEMLEEALSEGDSALVFTQYTEMGELLRSHLQQSLLEKTLFFHGGLPKPARDRMVEDFQGSRARIMVLSLRAGGTGLNLTAASHVFHYDRWWNPAVENQATDRAFRIGQKKKVQVRKFICSGTLEEKIDALIESKKALAGQVLGSGENWLTELSNRDLKELFALRREALEEEA